MQLAAVADGFTRTPEGGSRLKLTNFNHVGMEVRDLDRSIRFYTEVLGATLHRHRPGMSHAFVQFGPHVFVDLVQGERAADEPAAQGLPDAIHWAFQAAAEDVDENVKQLERHDVDVWGPAGHFGGMPTELSWYFRDPDGYRLEMVVTYPTAEDALKDYVRFKGPLLKPRPDFHGGPIYDAQGKPLPRERA